MADINVSMFPQQATVSSPPRVADVNMHTTASTTGDPSVQKAESTHIVEDGAPSQLELTRIAASRSQATILNMGENTLTTNSSPLLQNGSSHISVMQHKDPGSSLEESPAPAPAPAQTLTPTPLLLTYENSKEVAPVQQPSKEIVKVLKSEDDNKKLANIESPKVLPCVGAFTVQCALCMKWRLIPTKEQYEEIRQSVLEKPFFCSSAASWRPDVSCEDPSDVLQDESHLWAIDRPNIPVAPPGWERQLVIRAAGASKFADVYYMTPTGRKLRSMPEVERFLAEFPEYGRAGVKHSQFSFIIPRPLDSNYCRKKTAGPSDGSENQKKPLSTNKSKKPQVKKLSVKRKAFESLSAQEDSEEHDGHKKLSEGASVGDKGMGMDTSYNGSISQQVVKGSLPPEELVKGLFWARSDHASSSGASELPITVSQSDAPPPLQGKL